MQQRLPSLLDPPISFAHRGARAHAPENTLEAFTLGLRLGASGLESDVWLTSDGVPVLEHDGEIRVGRRRRRIGTMARAELPSYIPSLDDLLQHCGTNYHLSLDLKDHRAAPTVVAVVRDHDPSMLDRLWLCDWVLERTVALKAAEPDVRVVDSTRLDRLKGGPERRAADLANAGIDAVNMRRDDWSGGLTTLFHRFGRLAFGWDLQHPHHLTDGLRMGLDAIYSDHVDLMHEAFITEIG